MGCELSDMPRKLKPSTPFGERLIRARGDMSREAAGVALDLLVDTLGTYERGRAFPGHKTIVRIGDVYDISLDWLLTGREPMRPSKAAPPPPAATAAIDEELMNRVAEGIAEAYTAENARLYPLQLVQATSRMYADLVAACETPGDRQAGLKAMLQQLRRELRSPSAESKRLA